jgi:hypothetical protein
MAQEFPIKNGEMVGQTSVCLAPQRGHNAGHGQPMRNWYQLPPKEVNPPFSMTSIMHRLG